MMPDSPSEESGSETAKIELVSSKKTAWLQEVLLSFSNILIILIGVLTGIISILSRAAWYDVIIRTGTAILVMGIVLWLINWFFAKYIIEAKLEELKEEALKEAEQAEIEAAAEEQSTLELQA